MGVLTDQVEAQGVKINDLESALAEYQHKLNCTEEMLQQVLPLTDLKSNWTVSKAAASQRWTLWLLVDQSQGDFLQLACRAAISILLFL